MMGMDDVRSGHSRDQTRRDGMRRMSAQPTQRAQRPSLQPARFPFDARLKTEADQLAFDSRARGERARQLERVAFAAAK
jgi:hypothetical protein